MVRFVVRTERTWKKLLQSRTRTLVSNSSGRTGHTCKVETDHEKSERLLALLMECRALTHYAVARLTSFCIQNFLFSAKFSDKLRRLGKICNIYQLGAGLAGESSRKIRLFEIFSVAKVKNEFICL